MAKLKTLNELAFPSNGCYCTDTVREEAIKHYKDYKEKSIIKPLLDTPLASICYVDGQSEMNARHYISMMWFIKEFFNLTDEDVK